MFWKFRVFFVMSIAKWIFVIIVSKFHSFMMEGPYHIETNPLIQGTGFGMIGTSVMKELNFASLAP